MGAFRLRRLRRRNRDRLAFSLAAFGAAPAEVSGPHPDGTFTTADSRRFRPATVGDLTTAARIGGEQGLAAMRAACVMEGDPAALDDAAMEAAAPMLSQDVAPTCPHCAVTQSMRFDLPRFLVEALARERPFLLAEIVPELIPERIACLTYHKREDWPVEEFLPTEATLPSGESVTMQLAERGTRNLIAYNSPAIPLND